MIANRRRRRGGALVEAALTTTIFLFLVIGMIDLGIGMFRQHVLSQAARQGARQAIVHGSLAPSGWNGGIWPGGTASTSSLSYGPVTVGTAPTDAKVLAISPYLSGIDPTTVQLTYQWPNGNAAERSVQVTVTAPWTPIYTALFSGGSRTLSATSTMLIAH
jgi:Flp pilus assembly protein TadG